MARETLIIGDAWNTLDHPRDSTLHLARVARREFGMKTYWALPSDVCRENGALRARLAGELFDEGLKTPACAQRDLREFESVHWRADPPVGVETLRLWSLLAATTPQDRVRLVNSAEALLKWNEKFAPVAFADYAIGGMVADSESNWKDFFEAHPGRQLIAKPSGEAASRGVQLLPMKWDEALSSLRHMRREHGPWLILQEFDPKALTEGETRVFIVRGQVAAALNKRPKPGHPIMNLDLPAEARPELKLCEPTPTQLERARAIARTLANDGVWIATIDFIGDHVLEINVTSPGLISWVDGQLPPPERIAFKYWGP